MTTERGETTLASAVNAAATELRRKLDEATPTLCAELVNVVRTPGLHVGESDSDDGADVECEECRDAIGGDASDDHGDLAKRSSGPDVEDASSPERGGSRRGKRGGRKHRRGGS